MDNSFTSWGMLPNSSDWLVDRITTLSLPLDPTVALYPLLEETRPSVPTWVSELLLLPCSLCASLTLSSVPLPITGQRDGHLQWQHTGTQCCGHLHLQPWLHSQWKERKVLWEWWTVEWISSFLHTWVMAYMWLHALVSCMCMCQYSQSISKRTGLP